MIEKPSRESPIFKDEVQITPNAVLDGVIIQKENGQIEFINRADMEMFGGEIVQICRELFDRVGRCSAVELQQTNGFCFERNGKHFCASVIRLSDRDGTARIIAMIRDITSIGRLQQQSYGPKALGQMASRVAHDLSNAFSVIVGRVQLLQQHLHDQEALKSGLEIIEEAALEAAETIHRIQQFARSVNDTDPAPVDGNTDAVM